jgi:hypothetical protein
MRLAGSADALGLRITGYQFPDVEDPRKRYSWHMAEGEAVCPRGTWSFRFPALTCDESPRISAWLREVADYAERSPVSGRPGILEFTEPNLRFSGAGRQPGEAVLQVALDLEFQPPWHRRREAGDPFCLVIHLTSEQLRSAAGEWDEEIARYPDGTPY